MATDIEELVQYGSLREVVERGGCATCGACESLLGARMELGDKHRLRPALPESIDPEIESKLLRVCPGARVNAPDADPAAQAHPVVGNWMSVRKGYAVDPDVRFKAAAGGGLTALALHLLESGQVDARILRIDYVLTVEHR
jgi:coenzyme F420 hydrogenase subunit beta